MRVRASVGMPGPSSVTLTIAEPFRRSTVTTTVWPARPYFTALSSRFNRICRNALIDDGVGRPDHVEADVRSRGARQRAKGFDHVCGQACERRGFGAHVLDAALGAREEQDVVDQVREPARLLQNDLEVLDGPHPRTALVEEGVSLNNRICATYVRSSCETLDTKSARAREEAGARGGPAAARRSRAPR